MQRINDNAYILHRKPFRDKKQQLDIFTQNHGIICAILSTNQSSKKINSAYLQPLQSIAIEFELKTNFSKIYQIEGTQIQIGYHIEHFIFHQYLQELLLKLLPKNEPFPLLFKSYQVTLALLNHNAVHTALRQFEIMLLQTFSALIDGFNSYFSYTDINIESNYYFNPENGFIELESTLKHTSNSQKQPLTQQEITFKGIDLQAFKQTQTTINQSFYDVESTQLFLNNQEFAANLNSIETISIGAKNITQYLINQILNGKPLKTRALYKQFYQK